MTSQLSADLVRYTIIPENPQKPTTHLNKPTTIKVNGRMTHCEVDFLAGHKNAASGKAGFRALVSGFVFSVP